MKLNVVVTSLCWSEEWKIVRDLRKFALKGESSYWTVGIHPRVKGGFDRKHIGGYVGRCEVYGGGGGAVGQRGGRESRKAFTVGVRLVVQHVKALVSAVGEGGGASGVGEDNYQGGGRGEFEGLCTLFRRE